MIEQDYDYLFHAGVNIFGINFLHEHGKPEEKIAVDFTLNGSASVRSIDKHLISLLQTLLKENFV